jgi:hypothetical protein
VAGGWWTRCAGGVLCGCVHRWGGGVSVANAVVLDDEGLSAVGGPSHDEQAAALRGPAEDYERAERDGTGGQQKSQCEPGGGVDVHGAPEQLHGGRAGCGGGCLGWGPVTVSEAGGPASLSCCGVRARVG